MELDRHADGPRRVGSRARLPRWRVTSERHLYQDCVDQEHTLASPEGWEERSPRELQTRLPIIAHATDHGSLNQPPGLTHSRSDSTESEHVLVCYFRAAAQAVRT
jgi:hypothetical protein